MIIENMSQNTTEWDNIRLGIPTASAFKNIITSKGERATNPRKKYLYKLAGEKVSGEKSDGYYGSSMAKGHKREDESRELYSYINEIEVEQVGFCFFDEKKEFGCSPDGLVLENGGFETKNAESHVQVERIDKGWSTSQHFQQIQGSLLVTGREWWDLVSYSRGLKPIIIRFERDEKFIRILHAELRIFLRDLNNLIERISA
ncbi:MAG: YqaJ viral recombinase family protein [Planctomycetes bacterium]|nr:YqaJ viral recombinase family protein [Planctomycetota bacterium]